MSVSPFIDEAVVYAQAGDGGDGAVAWRREKFIPRGGPAGGDGGDGGSVILEATESMRSLLDFHYTPHLRAKNGQKGLGKCQFGAKGEDVIVRVPVGTEVFDKETGACLADLALAGTQAIVCQGGSGGFGNARFANAIRQAPDFAKPGLKGEQHTLLLSLKLMADVGLLGFPNAGKSTLLSRLSKARPKIADYPFTTLVPQLGVVESKEGRHLILADIPGLIEGAAQGVGLGFRFLKHLERVQIICHLIEPFPTWFSPTPEQSIETSQEGDDWVKRYTLIRKELGQFNPALLELPEVVVLNKADLLPNLRLHPQLKALEKFLHKKKVEFYLISALTGEGLQELTQALFMKMQETKEPA